MYYMRQNQLMYSYYLPTWILQVGENDQKLAEGITLYSIVAEMHERAAIIGPLVTVSTPILFKILYSWLL